ncbi:MAG: glycosyltransferase [Myxococcota bacterium]
MSSAPIVCLSSQDWRDPMWTNKQHVMSRLAKRHRVLYVDYRIEPFGRLRARGARGFLGPIVEVVDGVEVLSFGGAELAAWSPSAGPRRSWVRHELRLQLLRRYLKREGIERPILWVYHPGYGEAVQSLPRSLLVYDCVDEYTEFPEYRDRPEGIARREATLCKSADLVFTTSQPLFESKRAFNPEHTHLVHNVGDAEHFRRAMEPATQVPDDLAQLPRPVIGFFGAVSDYKLDQSWLLRLAEARPQWSVVVIGPVGVADDATEVEALAARENVHLLGHRPYADLPAYAKGFDVATIPYRINAYTRHCFPIKFFEYLATGKPVVISPLPSLEPYFGAVRVASEVEGFIDACEDALRRPEDGKGGRLQLADENAWPARIRKMMDLVEARQRDRAA